MGILKNDLLGMTMALIHVTGQFLAVGSDLNQRRYPNANHANGNWPHSCEIRGLQVLITHQHILNIAPKGIGK